MRDVNELATFDLCMPYGHPFGEGVGRDARVLLQFLIDRVHNVMQKILFICLVSAVSGVDNPI